MFRLITSRHWKVFHPCQIRSRLIQSESVIDISWPESNKRFDVIVVGAGIVGCAVARQLQLQHPELRIALIDKERQIALHQSSHNSGVLHAGLYYQPGSLKAQLCREGHQLLDRYANQNGLPIRRIGKLVVANRHSPEKQRKALYMLYERCQINKVPGVELLNADQIRQLEPMVDAVDAIWSPNTSIIDFRRVAESFVNDFQSNGGHLGLGFELQQATVQPMKSYPIELRMRDDRAVFLCRHVITACGLQSDRIARMCGGSKHPCVLPVRGEYLLMSGEMLENAPKIRCNVYPLPDPAMPFLGVHFTPRLDGQVWIGPNAVFSWRREAYSSPWFDWTDTWDSLSFAGTRKLAVSHWKYVLSEWIRSRFLWAQVRQARRIVPSLKAAHVRRGPVGVRAQALDSTGRLVDDFVFDTGTAMFAQRVLHVRNAPSPAATSSMAIARHVVRKFEQEILSNT